MNTTATRSVRRATQDDVATLARFRWAFRSRRHPAAEEENAFVERCVEWMRPRLRADSRWRVWLLEDGGTPVGNLWVQIIEKIPNPGTEPELHAYVSNVFVLPEYRNRGGGAQLLDAAIAECRGFHVDTMFLWPSDESRPLYARHGFAAPDRLLVKQL
jgi:GNAT superfamily N-acetyltransferase